MTDLNRTPEQAKTQLLNRIGKIARLPFTLVVVAMLATSISTFAASPPKPVAITTDGEFETIESGDRQVQSATGSVLVGDAETGNASVELLTKLSTSGYLRVILRDASAEKHDENTWLAQTIIRKYPDGYRLSTQPMVFDAEAGKWAVVKNASQSLWYWPIDRKSKEPEEIAGIDGPRKYTDKYVSIKAEAIDGHFLVWLDGQIISQSSYPTEKNGIIEFSLTKADVFKVGSRSTAVFSPPSEYLHVDLGGLDLQKRNKSFNAATIKSNGVGFSLIDSGNSQLDLSMAGWREIDSDPGSYYEWYDAGPEFISEPRQPMIRVPVADYVAAHILAYAEPSEATSPVVTLRAGRYGYATQTFQHEFATRVPPAAEVDGATKVKGVDGDLYHVTIPMDIAFAQDLTDRIDIELTKEVRLARRHPDPARFRYRPVGLPSGVKIAAITLERSPLQMRVSSDQPAHIFEQPDKPVFNVELQNITKSAQPYTIEAVATHYDGKKVNAVKKGSVQPGKTAVVAIEIPYERLGYFALDLSLKGNAGRHLLTRKTSFAMLPRDTRNHRATSPMGTWDFFGTHFTPDDAEVLGPLYRKAGLRYGMFGATPEERKKWGVTQGVEPKVAGSTLEKVKTWFERNPYADRVGLLLHEDGISGSHIMRVPDLFHNRAPYVLDEKEQARLDKLMKGMIEPAKALREDGFDIHLRIGNGGLPTKEELYRADYPADLFDSVGNEAGAFGRPPETQPPDWVANNASIWMDRVLADHYGFEDKPVTQCYEITYPSTNPGNLALDVQADYLVRHALHSLAWEVPTIRVGLISDVANSYYFSNWGAAGLLHAKPEINPKPSYVTFATMTRVLDGATFGRVMDMGSKSLYGLEFKLPDGENAYVMWNLHGVRPVQIQTDRSADWTRTDSQGNESTHTVGEESALGVNLSGSPIYLVSAAAIKSVKPGETIAETPGEEGKATLLSDLASTDGWELQTQSDVSLEYHNFMTPRRKGDFVVEAVDSFEGKRGVLKVSPRPIPNDNPVLAMPMYGVLLSNSSIELPGKPSVIGLWVNGNSGQGRIIFDLVDAKGERWTSIGASQKSEPTRWMLDWMPEDAVESQDDVTMADWNTDDVFGLSRIDFDGWQWLEFGLPGNYPGENYMWPATSQWRYDQDGIVDYPLAVRSVIVELNEKTLHMKTYEPVEREAVYIKDLTSIERGVPSHLPRGLDGHSGEGNRR